LIYTAIINYAQYKGKTPVQSWVFVEYYRSSLLFIGLLVLLFGVVDPYRRYKNGERAPYKGLYVRGGAMASERHLLDEKEWEKQSAS
jgi:hypothetical protein